MATEDEEAAGKHKDGLVGLTVVGPKPVVFTCSGGGGLLFIFSIYRWSWSPALAAMLTTILLRLRVAWHTVAPCECGRWADGYGRHVLPPFFAGPPHFGPKFNYLKIEKHRNFITHFEVLIVRECLASFRFSRRSRDQERKYS